MLPLFFLIHVATTNTFYRCLSKHLIPLLEYIWRLRSSYLKVSKHAGQANVFSACYLKFENLTNTFLKHPVSGKGNTNELDIWVIWAK